LGLLDDDEEIKQKKQAAAIRAAVTTAVTAAVVPLQRELAKVSQTVTELKTELKIASEKPNTATAVMDEETKKEMRSIATSAAAGIDSYKHAIYTLFGIAAILTVAILLNTYKLNNFIENIDWKYDAVTGILSGDRAYWWNGENYEASRKAPEAKQLQDAVDNYKKISEQMKKQAGNK
jgi:hypothetical protein